MANPEPKLRPIFCEAVERKTPQERLDYLDRACRDKPDVRARVDELLQAYEEASGFLEATSDSPVRTDEPVRTERPAATVRQKTREVTDRHIGPYKLLQKLGEGGMGTVYLAAQEEPVRRQVALKIIKDGRESAHVIARFEQERQALALMDHPNIAKVLDAGTIPSALPRPVDGESEDDGRRPYFVMELVKGIPITRYCDQEHLTPTERLELFIPVCQAVQHAHQKGIIHRDLKPSNVLVALYDGKPVPKVIDFGVAKATSQKLTERTLFTEVGQIVGTLEYMAPEQAEVNNLDIDTRADIYSLGVLLYELLTGSPPFTKEQLRGAAFTEMLRMIREVEPPKPSTKLSSSQQLLAIAANRKLEPKRLTKLVHGDLDWIVMKCLEKERRRRYETASALALDLARYLRHEPVEAGPPSAGYRLRKFVRRNRGPVVAAAVIALCLVGGIVGTTSGMVVARNAEVKEKGARALAEVKEKEARDERDRAYKANDMLTQNFMRPVLAELQDLEGIVRPAKPYEKRYLQDYLRDVLNQYTESAHPDPTGYDRLATFVRFWRLDKEAKEAYEKALDLREQLARDDPANFLYPLQIAEIHNALGTLADSGGSRKEAEQHYLQALDILQKSRDESVEPEAIAMNRQRILALTYGNLAGVLGKTGRTEKAEEHLQEALRLRRQISSPAAWRIDCRETAALSKSLADLQSRTQPSKAEVCYKSAIDDYRKLVNAPDDPVTSRSDVSELASTLESLADLKNKAGDHAGARHLSEEARSLSSFGRQRDKEYYNAARFLSRCVPLVEKDNALPEVKRRELARSYADQAMKLLEQAIQAGRKDTARIKKDPDLKPLHGRPDFQKLVAQLEKEGNRNAK